MKGRFRPPLYFAYVAACWYVALLMLYYWAKFNPVWLDRIIVGEIFVITGISSVAIFAKTKQWSRRGVGIWGFMTAAWILSGISLASEFRLYTPPAPQWIINAYRAPLSLACPLIFIGYVYYFRGMAWDDPQKERSF